MKNWLTPLAFAVLLAAPALAKDAGDKPAAAQSEKGPDERLAKLKKKLELSDDQAAKLKDIFKNGRESAKPLHEKMKKAIETLREQVKAKASDAELTKTLDELKGVREEMRAQMKKTGEAVEGVLTPTQRAKMALRMHKARGRMFGWLRGKHKGHHEGGEDYGGTDE